MCGAHGTRDNGPFNVSPTLYQKSSLFVVIRKGDSNASIRVLEKLMKPSELLEVS
jgi:hypothetical protein